MHSRLLASVALTSAAALAQLPSNTSLDRGEQQLNVTAGVVNRSSSNATVPLTAVDAGFGSFGVCSSPVDVPAGGGLPAAGQVVHAFYPDVDALGTSTVLQYRKSVDGGRTYGAPTTIYTVASPIGEDLELNGRAEYQFVCYGNKVFLFFLTNRDDIGPNGQGVYCVASDDQGANWSAPFRVTTNQGAGGTQEDIDSMRAAAGPFGAAVLWEYDVQSAVSGDESVAIAVVDVNGGAVSFGQPERDVTSYAPAAGTDADNPRVAVNGSIIAVVWHDDRNGGNQMFCDVSTDAGASWIGETQVSTGVISGLDDTEVEIFGNLVHICELGDRAGAVGDQFYYHQGVIGPGSLTFLPSNTELLVSENIADCDSTDDGLTVTATGRVLMFWGDQRTGSNAASNELYKTDAGIDGVDLIGGTATKTLFRNNHTEASLAVSSEGYTAVMWGEDGAADGIGIATSHDDGMTWDFEHITLLDTGGVDTDNPDMTLTANNDLAIISNDDRDSAGSAAGNAANNVFATGLRLPLVSDNTLVDGTITMSRIKPGLSTSGVAFLAVNISGTTNGGTVILGDVFAALDTDIFLLSSLASPVLANVSASGDVTFSLPGGPGLPPGGIPNLTNFVGVQFYGVGCVYDLHSGAAEQCSDPFAF